MNPARPVAEAVPVPEQDRDPVPRFHADARPGRLVRGCGVGAKADARAVHPVRDAVGANFARANRPWLPTNGRSGGLTSLAPTGGATRSAATSTARTAAVARRHRELLRRGDDAIGATITGQNVVMTCPLTPVLPVRRPFRHRPDRATRSSGRLPRGSSPAKGGTPGTATRNGGRSASRCGRSMPHRRCGGPSPAPPIRAGDRVWDAGRSVGERTPPRGSRGRTRQVWRSRSRGRRRRLLAGRGRCARGTWPGIYGRPRTEHTFCNGSCSELGGPSGTA